MMSARNLQRTVLGYLGHSPFSDASVEATACENWLWASQRAQDREIPRPGAAGPLEQPAPFEAQRHGRYQRHLSL